MECAAKGSRTPCCGPATRHCHRCRAVAYCSLSHQVSHRSVHRRECERLEQQMKRADSLNDFPFTFTLEAIQGARCSFLTEHEIHRLGMWMYECCCGVSAMSYDNSRLINDWNLPSGLCPCKGPSSPIPEKRLNTWNDYYEWRCIPHNSPAALLLHWPLTIYWAVQLGTRESFIPEISTELRIHYLGPEKELLQLAVFGELQALFPGVEVHIDLVGPTIPAIRNGARIYLNTYAQCNETNCQCKDPVENSCPITLRLHAGCYHDRCKELLKDSFPHIIIAPNAGIAAFTSWLPTLEVIKEIKVPAFFSDYCEEASLLAASCTRSVTGTAPKIQVLSTPSTESRLVVPTSVLVLIDPLVSITVIRLKSPNPKGYRTEIAINPNFPINWSGDVLSCTAADSDKSIQAAISCGRKCSMYPLLF